MIKIAFLHEGNAYLPEIFAYEKYLNDSGEFEAVIVRSEDEIDETFDIVWKMMGIDFKRSHDAALIHEYNTITVGKNAALKDLAKKIFNCKPDGRVFQNEKVKEVYNFHDNIPFIYRDMGIDSNFYYRDEKLKKEYDFVYVGTMEASRKLDVMLNFFRNNPDLTIMMIGTPNPDLQQEFGEYENISFIGRVDYRELPKLAAKARYGLNYIPDEFPFNKQTSTKLIEYCALGLNIVTTSYEWVNNFEKESHGNFYKVTPDLSGLTRKGLDEFNFITPNLDEKEWSKLFDEASLIPFLKEIYIKHIGL